MKKEQTGVIHKNQFFKIISNLFALWTISDFHNNNLKTIGSLQRVTDIPYLLKAHAAQVISIFRMLGLGYESVVPQDQTQLEQQKKDQVSKFLEDERIIFDNLVQIKTGEGKSITLAIAVSIFALLDYEVSCACYSQYLSSRDFQAFKSFFQYLNITDKIFYGTFNQICEKYINKDGDIRNLVQNLILKNSQIKIDKPFQAEKRVILIDEVDVLFSKEFFNKVYVPLAQIKNQQISNLHDYMWSNKDQKGYKFKNLIKTKEYQECKALFKDEFVGLFDEACKDMFCESLQYKDKDSNFKSHDYIVQDLKIGYQVQDQISFSKSYGYKTTFAYYHEYHNCGQRVTLSNLEASKSIGIQCGKFSYAHIPLTSMLILGVTGTLDSLSQSENDIIKDTFQIRNFTFSPSVYGMNKLQWNDVAEYKRLKVLPENEYFNILVDDIKSKIKEGNEYRAVIVFFKTLSQLDKFKSSNQYQSLSCEKQQLTEQCNEQEKNNIIIKATYQNTVTLVTSFFGRGTDFICRDEHVEKNGGVHVILTFMPDSKSEFVQIQGRTARQGNQGSFQLILLDQDLQKVGVDINSEEYKLYDGDKLKYIEKIRDERYNMIKQSDIKAVVEIKKIHRESLEIKDLLVQNQSAHSDQISQYLVKINAGPSIQEDEKPVKTMILMDATGSMSSLLAEAKNSVFKMYENAGQILEQNNLEPQLNLIQYACYRNYSSQNLILQHSPWESKPDLLKIFMDSIETSGGQGNEAVEIGLQHAVYEANNCGDIPLRQIYLIGDMPPNTQQEVNDRRRYSQYWKGTKFEQPTYWETEIQKLKTMNVVVHTFYLDNSPKAIFEEIAKRTGGTSNHLDLSKADKTKTLCNLFIPNILKMIGDANANGDITLGKKMVADYENVFGSA